MDALYQFLLEGSFFGLEIGNLYQEVVDAYGTPDGFVDGDPIFCCYEDLQLGFTHSGNLWYIALEPQSRGMIALPGAFSVDGHMRISTLAELLDGLAGFGASVVASEPFVEGDIWYRIEESGTLINPGEEGAVAVICLADCEMHGLS